MIAFGAGVHKDSVGYVNSLTIGNLNISGSNKVLVVVVASRDLGSITGITHNGNAMTKQAQSLNASVCGVDIWTIEDPANGTNDIVLSSGEDYKLFSMYAFYLTGADSVEVVNQANTGWSEAPSNSITTITANAWIVDAINLQSTKTIAVAGSQTERDNADHSDANLGQMGVSTLPKVTAGAQAMSWTWTTGDNWAHALIAIKPVAIAEFKPKAIFFTFLLAFLTSLTLII